MGKHGRWIWGGWLIPRGKQWCSRTTNTPCLFAGSEEEIQEMNSEIRGKPVRVRVTITELRPTKKTKLATKRRKG